MTVTPEASGAASIPTLERRLGPFDAAAIVLSNVIGGGIFFVPVIVAGLVPSALGTLGVWLLGGVLAFAGAMAYAELAALRPRAGGEYVYLREAFGPLAAFLTGWTSFVAGFSGAIAASAVALADYVGRFAPAAADRTPFLTIPIPGLPLSVSPQSLVALSAIAALSFVHMRGLGPGRLVHNVLAGLKVSGIVVFIALGLSLGTGSLSHLSSTHQVIAPSTGWLLALIPVMFSYSGWNAAAYVAEEIRDPGRNVPIALGLGTAAVVVLYAALNLLYLYAMPLADIAAVQNGRLMDMVAERLFGFVAGNLLAVFTIVSISASISAMVLAGPRVYFAMARDGAFLPSVARVHPTHRTPSRAILAQALWSGVLALSGTLAELVAYTGFAVVLFSGIAVVSLFVLRHRHPTEVRPFRAWGYPYAPALFVAASVVMVTHEIWNSPRTSLFGLAVIAVGAPLYFVFARPKK
ncbi:MAG: amino acid permease [Acidobacteria bacterium]|nr:amino acid permease [Acidobacteriota bacterium]